MTLKPPGIVDSLRRDDLRVAPPARPPVSSVYLWNERGELVEEQVATLAAARRRQRENRTELIGWLGWEPQGARTGEIAQLLRAKLGGYL